MRMLKLQILSNLHNVLNVCFIHQFILQNYEDEFTITIFVSELFAIEIENPSHPKPHSSPCSWISPSQHSSEFNKQASSPLESVSIINCNHQVIREVAELRFPSRIRKAVPNCRHCRAMADELPSFTQNFFQIRWYQKCFPFSTWINEVCHSL